MFSSNKRLVILDADGTTIDAYTAIDKAFSAHGMALGDEERFQKRRHLFKYLGGLKEFPSNLRKQIGKHKRKQLIATLTEVYREEALLYPGIAPLIQALMAAPEVLVGLVTRNITNEPLETLRILFARHEIDTAAFDFLVHIPLSEEKTAHFKAVRNELGINPARAYICGDEHKDYLAALRSGMHPFMVSYGFEDFRRLTEKFEVPEEVISRSPEELRMRLLHALDIDEAQGSATPREL
ncbi:MAG TPA: HAD family hydrolase [Burkholderiaceae bacterium]